MHGKRARLIRVILTLLLTLLILILAQTIQAADKTTTGETDIVQQLSSSLSSQAPQP